MFSLGRIFSHVRSPYDGLPVSLCRDRPGPYTRGLYQGTIPGHVPSCATQQLTCLPWFTQHTKGSTLRPVQRSVWLLKWLLLIRYFPFFALPLPLLETGRFCNAIENQNARYYVTQNLGFGCLLCRFGTKISFHHIPFRVMSNASFSSPEVAELTLDYPRKSECIHLLLATSFKVEAVSPLLLLPPGI